MSLGQVLTPRPYNTIVDIKPPTVVLINEDLSVISVRHFINLVTGNSPYSLLINCFKNTPLNDLITLSNNKKIIKLCDNYFGLIETEHLLNSVHFLI